MKHIKKLIAGVAVALGIAPAAQAQEIPGGIPNIAAVGVGVAPDYIGSDNTRFGGMPLIRYYLPNQQRFVAIEGNLMRINVLNHPNIRVGPAALYRFGRSNVKDNKVDQLPSISDTVELGGFVAYDFVVDDDPRNRWTFGTNITQDVGGVHKGYVANASMSRWFGVGRAGVFGVNAGLSYGSGKYMDKFFSIKSKAARKANLKTYNADSGFRDVRLIAMYIQPVSQHWAIGAGGMYQRIVDDAADSPIVKKRGSRNQWYFGAGIGRMW